MITITSNPTETTKLTTGGLNLSVKSMNNDTKDAEIRSRVGIFTKVNTFELVAISIPAKKPPLRSSLFTVSRLKINVITVNRGNAVADLPLGSLKGTAAKLDDSYLIKNSVLV